MVLELVAVQEADLRKASRLSEIRVDNLLNNTFKESPGSRESNIFISIKNIL